MFTRDSRYAPVPTYRMTDSRGRTITYKGVRFISTPRPQQGHIISEGERLDHIAHYYYGDPLRFWRICDANLAMWPDDLAGEIGRKIMIPTTQE